MDIQEIIKGMPSINLGLVSFYGRQTVLNALEAQQQEIEQLKEDKDNCVSNSFHNKVIVENEERFTEQFVNPLIKENTKLKEELQNIKDLQALALNLNADLNLDKSKLKQEVEQLKEENKNIKREAKKYFKISNNNRMSVQIDNQNLKRDNTKLKEEIRILKQDAEIAMTDKRQRKIRLNNHVKKLKN